MKIENKLSKLILLISTIIIIFILPNPNYLLLFTLILYSLIFHELGHFIFIKKYTGITPKIVFTGWILGVKMKGNLKKVNDYLIISIMGVIFGILSVLIFLPFLYIEVINVIFLQIAGSYWDFKNIENWWKERGDYFEVY